MINKLINKLSKSASINIIDSDNRTSFIRYMFFRDEEFTHDGILYNKLPWYSPFNMFLHHWIRTENDTFHSHPRWSITIVLKGKLIEQSLISDKNGTHVINKTLKPFSIVIRNHKHTHNFYIIGKEAWTIFIVGRHKHKSYYYDKTGKQLERIF